MWISCGFRLWITDDFFFSGGFFRTFFDLLDCELLGFLGNCCWKFNKLCVPSSHPLDERTWKKVGMEKGATKYLSNNEIQNMENLSAFHSKVEGGMAITRL